MILEMISLTIRPGEQHAFELAFAKAEPLLCAAEGYLSHELHRSIENEQRYELLIEWRRPEASSMGFLKSQGLVRLRHRIEAFLRTAPEGEYFEAVSARGARAHAVD